MTINEEQNKYAEAEILLDNAGFPPLVPEGSYEPTAEPLLNDVSKDEALPPRAPTAETAATVYNSDENHPSPKSHRKRHKRNVVVGTASGVVIGLIILGPIGGIIGGFGGNAIVRARERRYRRLHPDSFHRGIGHRHGCSGRTTCHPNGMRASTGVVS